MNEHPDPLSYNEILAYQYASHPEEHDSEERHEDSEPGRNHRRSVVLLAAVTAVIVIVLTVGIATWFAASHRGAAPQPTPAGPGPAQQETPDRIPFPMVVRINGIYRVTHHKEAVVTQPPLPDHNELVLTPMDTDQVFLSAFTTACTPSECVLTRYPLDQDDTSRLDDTYQPLRFRLVNGRYIETQPTRRQVDGVDAAGKPCSYTEDRYGTYNAPTTPDRFDGFFTEEIIDDGCLTKGAKGVSKIDVERVADLPPKLQARLNE